MTTFGHISCARVTLRAQVLLGGQQKLRSELEPILDVAGLLVTSTSARILTAIAKRTMLVAPLQRCPGRVPRREGDGSEGRG